MITGAPPLAVDFGTSFRAHYNHVASSDPDTIWHTLKGPMQDRRIPPFKNTVELSRYVEFAQFRGISDLPGGDPILAPVTKDHPGHYHYRVWKAAYPMQPVPYERPVYSHTMNRGGYRSPFRHGIAATALSVCALYAPFAGKEAELNEVAKTVVTWCGAHEAGAEDQKAQTEFYAATGAVILNSLLLDDYTDPTPDTLLHTLRGVHHTSWSEHFRVSIRRALAHALKHEQHAGFSSHQLRLIPPDSIHRARSVFAAHHLTR